MLNYASATVSRLRGTLGHVVASLPLLASCVFKRGSYSASVNFGRPPARHVWRQVVRKEMQAGRMSGGTRGKQDGLKAQAGLALSARGSFVMLVTACALNTVGLLSSAFFFPRDILAKTQPSLYYGGCAFLC